MSTKNVYFFTVMEWLLRDDKHDKQFMVTADDKVCEHHFHELK